MGQEDDAKEERRRREDSELRDEVWRDFILDLHREKEAQAKSERHQSLRGPVASACTYLV
jgi:hypothetical protein